MSASIREAVVAGAFYPAEPEVLQNKIRQFLDNARPPLIPEHIYGLICPHAGYDYSGGTAAYCYKLLKGRNYKRVIIFALSHRVSFPGVSIFQGVGYETPLGRISMDGELIRNLRSISSICHYEPMAHAMEHSLEVQLPFLQEVLEDFMLVPILTRGQDLEICRSIAEDVFKVIPEDEYDKTLVIGSTDLYHGEDYKECREKDELLAEAFEKYNEEFIQQLLSQGKIMACCPAAIKATMILSRLLGAQKASRLYLTNSGDVTGTQSGYVVGYLSGVLY